jgi:hypothetical protein
MAGRKYEPDRKRVRKNTQVVVSVSPNEKAEIEQEAKALGLSNSAYFRLIWLTHRKEH